MFERVIPRAEEDKTTYIIFRKGHIQAKLLPRFLTESLRLYFPGDKKTIKSIDSLGSLHSHVEFMFRLCNENSPSPRVVDLFSLPRNLLP